MILTNTAALVVLVVLGVTLAVLAGNWLADFLGLGRWHKTSR
jgi:hypothetical protein